MRLLYLLFYCARSTVVKFRMCILVIVSKSIVYFLSSSLQVSYAKPVFHAASCGDETACEVSVDTFDFAGVPT